MALLSNRKFLHTISHTTKLEALHNSFSGAADLIEEALDWIESDPPDVRAKRRRFTNGMWAIVRSFAGSDWLVLWEEDSDGAPVVRFIGETASL